MDYRTFGRTGLRCSVAGIGSGGASRLGLSTGASEQQAIALLRRALELGVNYFDTAAGYGTEDVIGRAFEGHRDEVVIASKLAPRRADGSLIDAAELRAGLELALAKLRSDVVDVYHLHRPRLEDYDYCAAELVPELESLRDAGKIRFIGISGSTSPDPTHPMLHRAVQDDCWDVVMVAFNLFNQSARERVFETSIEKDIAIEIMSAATGPYSRPEQFSEQVARLIESGTLDPEKIDSNEPTGFLSKGDGVSSLAEMSYRFACYEPGVHVVLIGTGNVEHLEENLASIERGPLPAPLHDHLVASFGDLAVGTSPGG